MTLERENYYFAEGPTSDKKSVKFRVYKWHLGSLYQSDFSVASGEPVGGSKRVKLISTESAGDLPEREELDFSTGTILDSFVLSPDNASVTVTLTTKEGETITQDSSKVGESKDYKHCEDVIKDQYRQIRKLKREM